MGAETQGQETAGLRAARPGPVLWLFRDAVWVPVEGRLYVKKWKRDIWRRRS